MKVNEIFGPTIQGEGISVGKKVIFLRLVGCNLHCVWCDTPYTWNWKGTKYSHQEKFDPKLEIHEMAIDEILQDLLSRNLKSLVVSGGEPLLQQKELIALFKRIPDWWIEIETNGTITPNEELLRMVNQFNCSPKLSNSGSKRINSEALKVLSESQKVWFKFIVGSEDDILEIEEYVNQFNLTNIILMPLGKTQEELNQTRQLAKDLANQKGFTFSDRLHIVLFNSKRAV